MLVKCHEAEEVVIYGVGEIGRRFLKKYGNACKHIAGFTVTC